MRKSSKLTMAVGMGLGAGLMYLLDPLTGRRRRALLGQKAAHTAYSMSTETGKATRDIAHRLRGFFAMLTRPMSEDVADDEIIEERVRSHLGRLSSFPSALEVHSMDGVVALHGPALRAERERIIAGVAGIRGVKRVIDSLEIHEDPASVSRFQGHPMRTGERMWQEGWPPALRVAGVFFGSRWLMRGLRRGGVLGFILGAVGGGLLTRSAMNMSWRRITGVGAGYRAIDIRKSIQIQAPVEQVYAFLRRFESFPRFMPHVHEVTDLGNARYHFSVTGPGGTAVSWNADLTRDIPNKLIGWRSVEGNVVAHAGVLRLIQNEGGTRLDVRFSYNPLGGAIGHGIAKLMGLDPKRQIDEDLARFKSLMERGDESIRESVIRGEAEAPIASNWPTQPGQPETSQH